MKHILIAGISGAVGRALAEQYLTEDESVRIRSLPRAFGP